MANSREMYDFNQSINCMYNNGAGYNTYVQIPYTNEYSFLTTNGSIGSLQGSSQDPLIINYTYEPVASTGQNQTQSDKTTQYTVQQYAF